MRAAVVLLLVLCACPPRPVPTAEPLRLGAMPSVHPEVRRRAIGPVAAWLGRRLGREVRVEVPDTYEQTARALSEQRWDLAVVGGLTYARAHEGGYDALAAPAKGGVWTIDGVIIARPGGPTSVAELKGRRLAFVDPRSTSGFQFPVAWLLAQGLTAADLKDRTFLGEHHAVVRAVAEGRFDAGACYEEAIAEALPEAERGRLKVLGRTDPVPGDVFAGLRSSSAMPALREAFAALARDPALKELMAPLMGDGLVVPDDRLLDQTRRIDLLLAETPGLW